MPSDLDTRTHGKLHWLLRSGASRAFILYVPVQETERELLWEFTILFPNVPGKTTIVVHDVDMGNIPPIKVHPYRMNQVRKANEEQNRLHA